MMEALPYAGTAILLIVIELVYFKLAEKYAIIDKPNQRSSHSIPTVRGGGVIFVFAIISWFVINDFQYPLFVAGLIAIAIISFLDDLKERSAFIRLLVHLFAFSLLLGQTTAFQEPLWLIIIITIVCLGTINAFNFMDGINGITGIYALVNLITFLYINETVIPFTTTSMIITMILSVIIFLFFNYRVKARCFAGDVGSVSLAFIQLFFLLKLCLASHYYGWILLFLMFGVDTVVTIIYRLRRKENIFKSHRLHLFQFLANELKISQRFVAVAYGVIQMLLNVILIWGVSHSYVALPAIMLVITGLLYVIVRELVLKKIGLNGLFSNL